MSEIISLRYRGDNAVRPGLPARDIDASELAAIAASRKTDVGTVADEAIGCGLWIAVHATEPEAPEASATDEAGTPTDPHAVLLSLTKADLAAIATDLELELPARTTNADYITAIEAEQKRLADAAEEAAGSGEGDQGGDSTPADDSEASATDEAGTPPSSGAADA